ncbi:hypothetical protein K435DRAFT_871279 [Dendrothele bispora CBS 962.96]|uniref:Uncharacterized protein n=1 Tax=Dendrothele bispora (strain CBS 962.96) TaxID=1314807 RepID=A0A4S8L540_DENBC|nr:hypothetical protein K435DRAFT_871279 [Dendrothele bispora CBS 962.96]
MKVLTNKDQTDRGKNFHVKTIPLFNRPRNAPEVGRCSGTSTNDRNIKPGSSILRCDYPTKPDKPASESESETKAKEFNFPLDNDKEETVPAAVDSGSITVYRVNQTLLSSLQDLTMTDLFDDEITKTVRMQKSEDEVQRALVKMEAYGLLPDLPTSPKFDDLDRKREHVKARKETSVSFNGNGTSPERSDRERVGTNSVAPSDPVKASPSKNNPVRSISKPNLNNGY